VIKHLFKEDVALMRDLLNVFGRAFDDTQTYSRAQPKTAYLQNLLDKDYFIALVALKQNEVVGGLAAYELCKFEQERSEIYIYDLAVSSEHRRQGIAIALIEALGRIATDRGAYVIFVQTDVDDLPAIQLYSQVGTRADVLHFDIAVAKDWSD